MFSTHPGEKGLKALPYAIRDCLGFFYILELALKCKKREGRRAALRLSQGGGECLGDVLANAETVLI